MLNPQAEAFVPATSSQRRMSQLQSLAASLNLPRQPAMPTISSQALFDDSKDKEKWQALEQLLNEEQVDSGSTTGIETGVFGAPEDAPPPHHSSFGTTMERCNPRSAILMWRNKQQGSKGRRTLRYLPLESNNTASGFPADLHVQPNRLRHTGSSVASMPPNHRWPPGRVPVEIFELIAQSLARDDVMSMRLVNHEFEDKVSRILFQTCVVPFNTELYDMIDDHAKNNTREATGKASKPSTGQRRLHWLNAKEDTDGKLYKGYGLRVFQGFGPHIKRFGMSFEVTEDQLSHPPIKKALDAIDSYHGPYKWTPPFYTRFANLAGLEQTADETSRMKAAFSNLKGVKELALSIDNGLGWLTGPDQSLRARIFKHSPLVFSTVHRLPSQQSEAAHLFWDSLQQSQLSVALPSDDRREVILAYRPLLKSVENVVSDARLINTHEWPSIDDDRVLLEGQSDDFIKDDSLFGVLYTTPGPMDGQFTFDQSVKPSELRKEQKEWLLEMDWAQRAFLESYMLAVVDNSHIFERVTTLNIAKLSSRFIKSLAGASFWNALPFLEDVTLLISPDWRSVEKDEAGVAATTAQHPSNAVDLFHSVLLQPRISNHTSVKRLKIGWVGGGEHAEGMYARNNHILPAPITLREHSLTNSRTCGIQFQNLEHLVLTNCWISPPALEGLLGSHADTKLRKLTLDSVSLTAHPNVPHQAGVNPAVPAIGGAFPGQPAMPAGFMHNNMLLQPAPAPNQAGVQPVAIAPGNAANLLPARHQRVGLPPLQAPAIGPGPNGANQNQPQQQAWWFNNLGAWPNQVMQLPAAVQPQLPHFALHHRSGSWANILNRYSPGVVLSDYLPRPEVWESPLPPRHATRLQTIEFKSCGYLLLNARQSFDQTAVEGDWSQQHVLSSWFRHRAASLRPMMMDTSDPFMGRIAQCLPQHEQDTLQLVWGLTPGWQEGGEDPTWDGLKPGGVGRFSGVVCQGMSKIDGRQRMDYGH